AEDGIRDLIVTGVQTCALPISHRTPHHVDVVIVHDREEPSANIGAGLPKMGFGNCAQQRFLHEIVCAIGTPSERPRIAPKSRNLSLDETIKFRHALPSSESSRLRALL